MAEILEIGDLRIPLDILRRDIASACRRRGWIDQNDICDAITKVWFHIRKHHELNPTKFSTVEDVLHFARHYSGYAMLHIHRERRRYDFEEPQYFETLTSKYRMPDEWEKLRFLLSDCEQILPLLAEAASVVREVFRLRYCQDMQNQHVALKLGITNSAATRSYQEAVCILRQRRDELRSKL